MLDAIAKEESKTILPTMMKDFQEHHMKQLTRTKIIEMTLHGLHCQSLDENNNPVGEIDIPCDTIVNALASQKNTIDLAGVEGNILYIGDCEGERPSTIDHAIKTAYNAANSIR